MNVVIIIHFQLSYPLKYLLCRHHTLSVYLFCASRWCPVHCLFTAVGFQSTLSLMSEGGTVVFQ